MMTRIISFEQRLPLSFNLGKIDMGLTWFGTQKNNYGAKKEKIKVREEQLKKLKSSELRSTYDEVIEAEKAQVLLNIKVREAGFFYNQFNAKADFSYWAKMSTWTIDEAVALTFGKDPRVVQWSRLEKIIQISSLAPLYRDRRLIFNRAVEMGQIYNKTIPSILIAWTKRMQVDYPTELEVSITALGIQICDWKSLYENAGEVIETLERANQIKQETIQTDQSYIITLTKKISDLKEQIAAFGISVNVDIGSTGKKERSSMLALIHAMGRNKPYSYDLNESSNGAIKRMENAVLDAGLSLSDKTIRKYLREANSEADRLKDKNQ
ncbi:MAG: hypothetical protein COA91_06550 [Robiginitomaculum sp.]|nr:MAG: hypothetical protein COA91_06550 [Robiginitomaculum sp.]